MTAILGVDISGWQHADQGHPQINFQQVREAGYHFVIIKCTQGVTYRNPWFKSDFELAKEAGLLVGAYHFAWPSPEGGEVEARFALDYTAPYELDLGITLDLEVWGDVPVNTDLQSYGAQFLHPISQEHEDAPQYSYLSFFQAMGGPVPNHKIWLAGWNGGHDYPTFWPRPWMTQNPVPQEVPGFAAPVDVDEVMSPRGLNPPHKAAAAEEAPAEPAEPAAEPVTES